MKIVQVCGWYFPDSLGGTETYVAALAEHLRSAGHETFIAAPDPASPTARTYEHDGVVVYRYPIPASPTRSEARHEVPAEGVEQFHEWLARLKPDVVHFHTFVTGVGPHEIAAARKAGARVFVTTHAGSLGFLCQRGTMMRWGTSLCDGIAKPGKCAACALQERGVPRPVGAMLGLIPPFMGRAAEALPGRTGTALGMTRLVSRNQRRQAALLRDIDGFFVLTDWAQRALAANGFACDNVRVNRLGLRAPRLSQSSSQRPHIAGKPLTIAYLGRFERIKGVHDFARAIRSLGGIQAHFEFRGPVVSSAERNVVDEIMEIVGDDARVRFGAPVPPDQVLRYLETVDLLCVPSITLEGGPTAALEAMAVGTPVVATSIGAMAEIIQDDVNGRLVPPGDWRAIARVIRDVVDHPDTTIHRWRDAIPPMRTMTDVANDYLRAYGTSN